MSGYVGLRQGKVHEEHTISEYYCGGCGWPVTDHDSYCPECGGALKTAAARDFDAEVAKLRAERDHWHVEQVHAYGNWEDAHKRVVELENQNAKLRELLHDFLSEHADYFAEGNYFIGDLDLEHAMHHNQAYFRREAKKLGIEVDG